MDILTNLQHYQNEKQIARDKGIIYREMRVISQEIRALYSDLGCIEQMEPVDDATLQRNKVRQLIITDQLAELRTRLHALQALMMRTRKIRPT
jgi:hypothetical protein